MGFEIFAAYLAKIIARKYETKQIWNNLRTKPKNAH
jgi:hypothetical protein